MSEEPPDIEALRAELSALRGRAASLERQLAASEARAARLAIIGAVADTALDVIGAADLTGRVTYLNPAARRIIGYGPDEDLAGLTNIDILGEGSHDRLMNEARPTAAREGTWQGEVMMRCRDGREYPTSMVLSAHRGPHGKPIRFSAILRDITAMKQLEGDLRAAEERLRHLLRSCPVVVYTARAGGAYEVTFVSDSVTEVLGHSPADFMEREGFWAKHIHPEDAARAIGELNRILELGENSHEYRFLDGQGRYLWLLDQSKVVYDAAGKPLEIVGSVLDITNRKEAEQMVMELSTPLIPVSDRVLVMPLIGRIDQQRAHLVLSTLLEGIGRMRAEVAILDITGVEQVNEEVGAGLVKAAQAVGLLGAEVVITGIRPEVAQALVQIGVDLSRIVTLGSLQAGIAYAMRRR